MKNTISIVVPVYNVEKYLEKCIKSIIGQTYEALEIILVDDGSTDESGAICDKYAHMDERIAVLHKQNGGLSEARNVGIDFSHGKYIMLIDADDYIEPHMTEVLMEKMKTDQSDMAICSLKRVDEEGYALECFDIEIEEECLNGGEALEKLLLPTGWNYVVACNKLYKKEILSKYPFPVGKVHEDEYVAHRILYACKKISCTKEVLYNYLIRTGSITQQNCDEKVLDVCDALMDRVHFAIEIKHREMLAETFYVLTNRMIDGYRLLDRKGDTKIKSRLEDLKKETKQVYGKYIRSEKSDMKNRITYPLFLVNYKLCDKVLKFIRKAKAKSGDKRIWRKKKS